ncbi:MAG: hypothetical protein HUU22_14280, partial [Phycisphaerae bacterium]|nr:hypothetical protein [Phycisphaerae bacterium]
MGTTRRTPAYMNRPTWTLGTAIGLALAVLAGCQFINFPGTGIPTPTNPPITPEPPAPQPDTSGGENRAPVVTFQWPTSPLSIQNGATVNIQWTVMDPEDSARVTIFARDANGSDSVLVSGQPGTPPQSKHSFIWKTDNFSDGTYQIVANASDGKNPIVTTIAPGAVTIVPRPPPPPP